MAMRTDRRQTLVRLGAGLAAALAATGASAQRPLVVVATTGMIADIVREVAGERAQVTQLMGEGVDPHLYKTTRSDIASMLNADIVFYNGLLLEGKMSDALQKTASAGRAVFTVTDLLSGGSLVHLEGGAGHVDPHVWMDPVSWARAVEVVRDRLTAQDAAGSAAYAANATGYLAELARLDAYAREVLTSIPTERRILVTAHDAFSYLGRRYAIEVRGIQGISTDSEAGLRRIEELVALLVDRRVPAVFAESTVATRSVEALIAGAAARGHEVRLGGRLFSDAMGAPGTYEGSYVGMIDHNVTVIARGLGGSAPERGMNGRLAVVGL